MQQGEPEDIDRSGGEPHNRDHRHDDRQNRRRPGNEQAGARDHERKREDPGPVDPGLENRCRQDSDRHTGAEREQDQVEIGAFTGDDLIDEDRTERYEHAATDHPRGQADVDRPDDRVDRDELPALAEFAERPAQIPVPPLRAESLLAGAAGPVDTPDDGGGGGDGDDGMDLDIMGRKGGKNKKGKKGKKGKGKKGKLGRLGNMFKGKGAMLTKAGGAVAAVGLGAYTAYSGSKQAEEDADAGKLTAEEEQIAKAEAVGEGVGGASGALAGAAAGAAIGSAVPIVGTVVGGLIGGASLNADFVNVINGVSQDE